VRGKRRGVDERLEEALRRGRDAFDVDVLHGVAPDEIAQAQQQRRAAAAASAEEHWNPRPVGSRAAGQIERIEDAALERRPLRNHHDETPPAICDGAAPRGALTCRLTVCMTGMRGEE